MVEYPKRRVDDHRIDEMVIALREIKGDVKAMASDIVATKITSAAFVAGVEFRLRRGEEEVKKHADEIGEHSKWMMAATNLIETVSSIESRTELHEKWINRADGKNSMISLGFGGLGAAAVGVIKHIFKW
jgi:hypothetical protein